MCTVHRNTTFSSGYIGNTYCVQEQNTLETVHQKCVLCTETEQHRQYIGNVYCAQKKNTSKTVREICLLCTEIEHFPGGPSEMSIVHRNKTLSSRYIRNEYCAQKHNNFKTVIKNVYCAQKQNTFKAVHQKYVLSTEREHFPDGISVMCTVHRNRTISRRYIRNVYCA